jgi:hypothetical protein
VSESVEQAALRRAAELDDLPAPWGSVLKAIEAGERLNRGRWEYAQALGTEITELHDELAEMRDAMLALSNRIENLTRTVTNHHGLLAQLTGRSPLDGVS